MNCRNLVGLIADVINQDFQQIFCCVWFMFYDDLESVFTNHFQVKVDGFVMMQSHDVEHHVVHIILRLELQVKRAALSI